MQITPQSHLDHGLSPRILDHIRALFAGRTSFFIETITLPPELGEVESLLYGPLSGDSPVCDEDGDVFYERRGRRRGKSRMVRRPARLSRRLTVVAGPHYDGRPCVLYTAHGGESAPREPWSIDPQGEPDAYEESAAFWCVHALASLPLP